MMMIVQMFNEVQMVTPMVGSREVYFVRYCKKLKEEEWAIVDVSIDKVQDSSLEASLLKCRKRPSIRSPVSTVARVQRECADLGFLVGDIHQ